MLEGVITLKVCPKSQHSVRTRSWNAEIRTPASRFERLAEETGIGKAMLHDGSETVEAKVY